MATEIAIFDIATCVPVLHGAEDDIKDIMDLMQRSAKEYETFKATKTCDKDVLWAGLVFLQELVAYSDPRKNIDAILPYDLNLLLSDDNSAHLDLLFTCLESFELGSYTG